MKRIILASISIMALSTTAFAAEVGGKVSLDFSQNDQDKVVIAKELELDVTGTAGVGQIGLIVDENNSVVVDTYSLGSKVGNAVISYGDQGDLLDNFEGQTEAVGGQTLTNLDDDYESLKVEYAGIGVLVGFKDVATNAAELSNVQLSTAIDTNGANFAAGVDWDKDTKDLTVAAKAGVEVNSTSLEGTVTWTEEVTGYEIAAGLGNASVFLNGDNDDMTQNIGAGYYASNVVGLNYYAEAGYNFDSEKITPAAGVSFQF